MLVKEITPEEDCKINNILDSEINNLKVYTKLSRPECIINNTSDFLDKTKQILNKSNSRSKNKQLLAMIDDTSKSIDNVHTVKKKKVVKEVNYQSKYEKIKNEIDKLKKELVKERMSGNDIKKQFKKAEKKEAQYDELFEENQKMMKETDEIYNKILESEEIRKEQDMLIMSLQLEYDQLKKCFRNENYDNGCYEKAEKECVDNNKNQNSNIKPKQVKKGKKKNTKGTKEAKIVQKNIKK